MALLFKDLRANYPLHILDKNELTIKQGKVISVSIPRIEPTCPGQMVIDLGIELDGKSGSYVLPENQSIAYAKNLILTTEKQALIAEVEALKANAEQILNSVESQKEILAKSEQLLSELNPSFKEKRETSERLNRMEDAIAKLSESVTSLINEFKK